MDREFCFEKFYKPDLFWLDYAVHTRYDLQHAGEHCNQLLISNSILAHNL